MKTMQQTLSEISSANRTYHRPSIKVNNRIKIEGQNLGQRSQPPKGTSSTPKTCVCNMEIIQHTVSDISSGTCTYHPPPIKVNNRLKIEGQKLG